MDSCREGYPTGEQQGSSVSALWPSRRAAGGASLRRARGRAERGLNLLTSHFGTRHVEEGV